MKDLADLPRSSLDKKTQEKLNQMRESAYMIRKSKSYVRIVNAIKETFSDMEDMKPLTVGSFFYGCIGNTSYDGSVTCSKLCSDSMPLAYTPGVKDCDVNVAVSTESGIVLTHSNPESQSLLLHAQDDFMGFSSKDAKMLSKRGIEKVTISYSDTSKSRRTGSVEDLTSKTSESESEECKTKTRSSDSCDFPPKKKECDEGNGFFTAVIIFIVLLIIVGIIIYFCWTKCVTKCPEQKECKDNHLDSSMLGSYL